MRHSAWRYVWSAGCAGLVALGLPVSAQQESPSPPGASPATANNTISAAPSGSSAAVDPDELRKRVAEQGDRIDAMRSQISAQIAQLDAMKRALAEQEADYKSLRHAVGIDVLDKQRAGSIATGGPGASALPMPAGDAVAANAPQQQPVGEAPKADTRPPEVAPIFQQPGVLTPKGKFIMEPAYQFGYSSVDRVALVGYTVIPAILIGLIDARQVRTTTQVGWLTTRYGLSNRLEVEVRVPYVYAHEDVTSREIFTGSATDKAFGNSGHGLGDIEATARYQLNVGGPDKAYYVGWLRVKSNTGKDPFQVTTDCVQRCVENVIGQVDLAATGTGLPLTQPVGTGFWAIQPGVTWLYPTDPVVFFGNFSYLYNVPRDDVTRKILLGGTENLGKVKLGDIVDVSVGMGLSLNEKASISIGYDQSFVGATKQNNHNVPGSTKIVLGTLLIGGSWRFSDKRTLNFTLGVGVTRDTPDATVTVRVPMMF
ncbi:acetate kinase [Dyella kyungheensis]|uniref:Acetate kinase n=2 Tax=Dyella kyungheensis TaxID=1242174 RepID=A0ABS2JM50_9GAMM|nr:acetate kinase [Dyella kyungheensis]